jgi:hypothetical protein
VLIDDDRVAGLGAALAWAQSHGAAELNVLAGPVVAGIVARRASQFSSPPSVWAVEGRVVGPASPAAPLALDGTSPDPAFVELLRDHGATPVFEHGVLRGEVLGLEVARVVNGHLEVGVGRHDRLARSEMRPGQDLGEALDETVAAVAERRRAGAPPHPANTLARARWLRAVVCAHPDLVGARSLEPVEPPLPWVDLPEVGAAPCVGGDLVVVCSVGVDLDLIPTAADCRLIYRPNGSLTVVVPEGDDIPVTRALAEALAAPASVVTVPRDWASLLSTST